MLTLRNSLAHIGKLILAPLLLLAGTNALAKPNTPQVTVSVPGESTARPTQKESTRAEQKVAKAPKKKNSVSSRTKCHGGRCPAKKKKRDKVEKKPKKTIKDMSYEELKELKVRLIAEKKTDAAMKCLEKMVAQCKDVTELKTCMIELAELLFDAGKLVQAEKMYTEFSKLYPGSEKIETVLYKAILCAYYGTLDAQHDQTKTHDAIALATQFLERENVFTTYASEVKKIKQQCHAKLLASEENIVNFYFKRGSKKDIVAAENRIQDLHKDFIPLLPEAESRVLALECTLAEKQHDPVLAIQKREQLATVLAKAQASGDSITVATTEKSQNFTNRF